MPRYKLSLEYAGTRYSGWQAQQNARTVQGELHRAIHDGLKISKFETYGSGRTDAGVHALRQVAHLDVPSVLPDQVIVSRLNAVLPHDINVLTAERVPARFHARHSALARSYLYQVARRRTAFAKPFVWWVREPLEADRMRDAGARVIGFVDFRSFTDDDPEEKSTRVLVDSLTIEESGALLLVRIVGSHFLWKMVRRIVGVLVEVGQRGLNADDLERMLRTDSELPARLTAPASGLFLERVFYEGDRRDWPLTPVFNCPAE